MKRKAQSTIEYMVLFIIIVGALIATQVYIKRGMQGRLKGYAGELSQGDFYSPGATGSLSVVTTNIEETTSSHDKKNITESKINRLTNQEEETLPFTNEPSRW